jgi:hypothetical protein
MPPEPVLEELDTALDDEVASLPPEPPVGWLGVVAGPQPVALVAPRIAKLEETRSPTKYFERIIPPQIRTSVAVPSTETREEFFFYNPRR